MRLSILLASSLLALIPRFAAAQEPEPTEPTPEQPPAGNPPASGDPQESVLGGVGQPCRGRWQCRPENRCLRNICVSAATFLQEKPESAASPDGMSANRFYLGGAFGSVLPGLWRGDGAVGFQASLRFGVILNHFQLQIDVSPGGTVIDTRRPIAMFEAAATAGYLIPMNDIMSWVFRLGGGGGFTWGSGSGDPTGGAVGYTEIRAEVVGVAIQTSDHFFVELNAPSWRVLFPSGNSGGISMLFVSNVALNYLF